MRRIRGRRPGRRCAGRRRPSSRTRDDVHRPGAKAARSGSRGRAGAPRSRMRADSRGRSPIGSRPRSIGARSRAARPRARSRAAPRAGRRAPPRLPGSAREPLRPPRVLVTRDLGRGGPAGRGAPRPRAGARPRAHDRGRDWPSWRPAGRRGIGRGEPCLGGGDERDRRGRARCRGGAARRGPRGRTDRVGRRGDGAAVERAGGASLRPGHRHRRGPGRGAADRRRATGSCWSAASSPTAGSANRLRDTRRGRRRGDRLPHDRGAVDVGRRPPRGRRDRARRAGLHERLHGPRPRSPCSRLPTGRRSSTCRRSASAHRPRRSPGAPVSPPSTRRRRPTRAALAELVRAGLAAAGSLRSTSATQETS